MPAAKNPAPAIVYQANIGPYEGWDVSNVVTGEALYLVSAEHYAERFNRLLVKREIKAVSKYNPLPLIACPASRRPCQCMSRH